MIKFLESLTIDEILPILNSIKDAIFIDDENGVALWCNKASEELYTITLDDIRGKHVTELERLGVFTPSVASSVLEQKKEVTLIHENMNGKRLLTTGTPILDKNGKISKIISTSRDITELVSLQAQLDLIQNTLQELKSTEKLTRQGIVANSEAMHNVLQLVKRLANVDSTVLITGESGVGKGIVAEFLHKNGSRRDAPFVKVNCGAIPENLIETELFGYESGSFTGSSLQGKKGLFETAQNGTIFLDEISELPLALQVSLLQVIQEREIKKVGGVKSIPIDVRVVSATNKDLHDLVQKGKFREDLYYRLNVVPINVPPLRERFEDIMPLINLYLNKYNKKLNDKKTIDPNTLAILLKYDWPGNVRELQNMIERLIITTKADVIMPEHLPNFILETANVCPHSPTDSQTLRAILDSTEKEVLLQAYKKYKSTRAIARALNISQPSVVRKLQKYSINAD